MLISIIIPAYYVEDYIEECVRSAFGQTYKPIEVICIDNNSTDNTWQRLLKLQTVFPDLIIEKELKPGAPAARNKGLALSKGKWIQFLDSDDLLLPNKIEHQVSLIQNKPEVCFIAAASKKKHINGQITISVPKQDNPYISLFTTNLGITSSNLWNRTFINRIRGWDESLQSSQEADLMFRLLQINSQVIFDAEPLTIIQERETGQISTKHPQDNWVRYFNKRVEILNWIKENDTKLYTSHQAFFNDSLFGILKIISNQKPDGLKVSSQLWKSYLKEKYVPSPAQNHSTKPYLFLYKILGFTTAERIRLLLGKQ